MQRVMVPKGPRARQLDWTTRASDPPLPDWLQLRDDQLDAVERAVKEYEAGANVVFLDAPTGSGKTIMAELIRRRLDVAHGLYICTTKSLQDQVARDFEYARVLKGRANYLPTSITSRERDGYQGGGKWARGLGVTCGDCDRGPAGVPPEEQSCSYCAHVDECPYLLAREEAAVAPVGILNTAFLMTHLNGANARVSPFAQRELVVADECDLLEDELLGYVEVRLAKKWVEACGLEVPKKGSHMTTIRAWLGEDVEPALIDLRTRLASRARDLDGRREYKRCDQMVQDVRRVLNREDGWVRDGDEEGNRSPNALVLKPVSVEDVGDKYLWRHGERWLCMSGTIVSAETMAEGLGLEEAGIRWGTVELPMRFDKTARRVVYVPVASMTRKAQDEHGIERTLRAIDAILAKHPVGNVLIHTHTYKLAKETVEHLQGLKDHRPVITYTSAREREDALARFRLAVDDGYGAVLVASSMDRGIDLPGDLCRVQVIVKVPMASLGSRQVSERLRTPGGDSWYLANTVRTIMQMTGRAVRGVDDWAVCYVLDAHFSKVLKDGKRRGMWPQWWLDALELGRVREYA